MTKDQGVIVTYLKHKEATVERIASDLRRNPYQVKEDLWLLHRDKITTFSRSKGGFIWRLRLEARAA